MNAPRKLRPAPDSQLRRLKELSAAERAIIAGWKDESTTTEAELRKRVEAQFGIRLKRDDQLSKFWQWQFRQAAIDHLGEMMSQDEQLLTDSFPGRSRDAIRDAAIKRGYAVADLAGDVKLSLRVAAVDLKDQNTTLDRNKFEFDAAKACLAMLPALKVISQDKGLSEPEKVQQIRLKLFGVVPG